MRVSRKLFWAVTVTLSVVALVLASASVWLYTENTKHVTMLENANEQSFYDLVQGVDDIDVKLKKLGVSSSKEYQGELLAEVWRLADVAQANLASLSHGDTVIEKSSRLLNQTGDYAKHLVSVTKTRALNAEEKASIKALYQNCNALSTELSSVMTKLGEGYSFVADGEADESLWSQTFSELEDTSIDYPSLIYDGPFSDSVQNKKPAGQDGTKITAEQGLAFVKEVLSVDYPSADVKYVNSAESKIDVLTYAGDGITVQLSANGRLVTMSAPSEVGEREVNVDVATQKGKEFLENAGFCDMTAVWVSYYYDSAYINFVCEKGGVIIYPDMVKVKVSLASGKVTGVEAQPHYYCCRQRGEYVPTVTEDEVRASAPNELEVESVRLAVVPKGSSEVLAYEVYGTVDKEKYFVYYDAETGQEINVLYVVDGEQGLLL